MREGERNEEREFDLTHKQMKKDHPGVNTVSCCILTAYGICAGTWFVVCM